ncbi:MAG: sporulation peptidase YabG [Negativicutes bacterium]|nr:sporulation peptidase YabG [Negativicutes bacterium]
MASITVGDFVIRKSHGGDIMFKVTDIYKDDTGVELCTLKGLHLRLLADAPLGDLERVEAEHLRREIIAEENRHNASLDRIMLRRGGPVDESQDMPRAEAHKKPAFFDLPGRVLHLDGDEDYLKMCLKTYNQLKIEAVGRWVEESKQPDQLLPLLKEVRPDILIVTGHDALIGGGKKGFKDINNYRTSKYFIRSVQIAREYQSSRDDLVIFAGACQSYFEAILTAGANFASSPGRIFIHAYDPVFIAEKVAFTPINRTVDINEAISASVTGIEGVGGVESRGKFRLGMPKSAY